MARHCAREGRVGPLPSSACAKPWRSKLSAARAGLEAGHHLPG